MIKKTIETTVFEYDTVEELSAEERNLCQKAQEVLSDAYAPYSNFFVGAAVLLENGEIVTGTNQENAAYPSGLCAERVAMFYANSKFPNVPVKAIAVSAATGDMKIIAEAVPPCGSCRQVLMETEIRFNKPIKIILAGSKKIAVLENAKSLLPIHFDDDFLNS